MRSATSFSSYWHSYWRSRDFYLLFFSNNESYFLLWTLNFLSMLSKLFFLWCSLLRRLLSRVDSIALASKTNLFFMYCLSFMFLILLTFSKYFSVDLFHTSFSSSKLCSLKNWCEGYLSRKSYFLGECLFTRCLEKHSAPCLAMTRFARHFRSRLLIFSKCLILRPAWSSDTNLVPWLWYLAVG